MVLWPVEMVCWKSLGTEASKALWCCSLLVDSGLGKNVGAMTVEAHGWSK